MSWQLFLTGVVLIVAASVATVALDRDTTAQVEQPLRSEQQLAEQDDATPEPTPVTNRENCDQIRGSDYLSAEERSWFLDNCVGG